MVKIRPVTLAIILALTCAVVAPTQTRRRSAKRKAPTKTSPTATVADPPETPEQVEGKRQLGELARLSPEQLTKLKETIDLVQFVTRKVKLAGFPPYFMSENHDARKVETAVNGCLDFIPAGLMRSALEGSFRALIDAWILDQAASSGIVTSRITEIIDRYKLEDTGLYLLTRQVLDIGAASATVASRMFELIPAPANKPQ